jgi:hypothetical protein
MRLSYQLGVWGLDRSLGFRWGFGVLGEVWFGRSSWFGWVFLVWVGVLGLGGSPWFRWELGFAWVRWETWSLFSRSCTRSPVGVLDLVI